MVDGGEFLQLVIQSLLLLFALYLAFFKSYFQEKGKNLATQEDIHRITSLVENVKTQIQFSLQAKLVLKREEHDALLQYYSQLYAWVDAIANFKFTGITYKTLDKLDERIANIDAMHRDTSMALSKVEVLIGDEKFKVQGRKLIVKILKFQQPMIEMCGNFKLSCIETQKLLIEAKRSSQTDAYRESLCSQGRNVEAYNAEQCKRYSELYPHVVQHRQSVSALLQSIVAEGKDSASAT